MKIVFLHLSDMHIRNEKDISDVHIGKIVESLKSYKFGIKYVVLVISGDLTESGEKTQFINVAKVIGTIIKGIKDIFKGCSCNVLVVPGNHDVEHKEKPLPIEIIEQAAFSSVEISEHSKLTQFYVFSKYNRCFSKREIYCDTRNIEIEGFKIRANLINNAIFSTRGEYKGLLYIPTEKIDELQNTPAVDFVITIMHHAPDFYRDDIKNAIEEKIVANSTILFYGHEHHNGYRRTSYNGSNVVIIQSGGCLCNKGNWSNGSYRVGILDTETKEYAYQKFHWNKNSNQYEHDEVSTQLVDNKHNGLQISSEFKDIVFDEDFRKDYFVFPTVLQHTQRPEKTQQFDDISSFLDELLQHKISIITGTSNVGKSALLKKLFEALQKKYNVLLCSPEMILGKSKSKKQNIDKLIKELFEDIYGESDSLWQSFEQSDKSSCIFIFDDFDRTEGINIDEFTKKLSDRFGTIILSSGLTIDFDPSSIFKNEDKEIGKFEIKPLYGNKRKQLIEAVVRKKAVDKSEVVVSDIVSQINQIIRSQLKIIPPEPYFIIQFAEHYFNNVGEAVNSSTNVFSKVFEANITMRIDIAIKKIRKNFKTDLLFVLFGKIAHYIHFNKRYPISRREIDVIIQEYNDEYGNILVTQDIIDIAKTAKILSASNENSELFRFGNKSILAYFIAKETISKYGETKEIGDIKDIINKSCFNICTDILLFIIFQTNDVSILNSILEFISHAISLDENWKELDFDNNMPIFFKSFTSDKHGANIVDVVEEKEKLAETEEKAEEVMISDFRVKDIYDWDEEFTDEFNNKLIRMTSLLHILSKSLPCFEHRLKKSEKRQIIECLYRLPNMIFMFWATSIDANYNELIEEIKLLPYLSEKSVKLTGEQLNMKAHELFAMISIHLLFKLYYLPAISASDRNTYRYLDSTDFFDFTQMQTHRLQHLMMLEQNISDDGFVKAAIKMADEFDDYVSAQILRWIVRHGIITRNDKREDAQKLQQKFFSPASQTPLLIARMKNKALKE